MTCRELLQQFVTTLERDEPDWVLLRKLMRKCGAFGVEALKAMAKKAVQIAASKAWAVYRGALIAERDPAIAYGQAVHFVWHVGDWYGLPCSVLAEMAVYVAEAAVKYSWPARWPFLIPAAVAAEVNGCELPDSVAEALGADEYARLEAFLELGEAVAEVAPGVKVAFVRDGRYVSVVV
ncbi:MAG: hypothetical protein ACO2PM_09145 [Pyrobaculum sp.]|jgi:hypothetical protein